MGPRAGRTDGAAAARGEGTRARHLKLHEDRDKALNSANWDGAHFRDDLGRYVVEHLGEPGGIRIVGVIGFEEG